MRLCSQSAVQQHETNGVLPPNKSLERTFDPPPIFAAEKTGVASNAAELRR